jgi:putative FmdB family regulatory protein
MTVARRDFSISSLGFAMPIYEYKCNKCGVFEAMQGIKESPLRKCPTCKGKIERQMSRGSFILKGSGWYATDYAKKSTPASTDSDSSAVSTTPATNGSTASSNDSSSKPAIESKPAAESKSSSTSESKPSSRSKSSSEKSVSAKSAD